MENHPMFSQENIKFYQDVVKSLLDPDLSRLFYDIGITQRPQPQHKMITRNKKIPIESPLFMRRSSRIADIKLEKTKAAANQLRTTIAEYKTLNILNNNKNEVLYPKIVPLKDAKVDNNCSKNRVCKKTKKKKSVKFAAQPTRNADVTVEHPFKVPTPLRRPTVNTAQPTMNAAQPTMNAAQPTMNAAQTTRNADVNMEYPIKGLETVFGHNI